MDESDVALMAAFRAWIAANLPIFASTAPAPVPAPTPAPTPAPVPSSPLLASYTTKMKAALATMSLATPIATDRSTFASAPAKDRAYYDVPLGLWRLHALTADAAYRDAAVRESAAYRTTLVWNADRSMAWPSVQSGWTPAVLLDPEALRRCYALGQLVEWQRTSLPAAKEASLALASTVLAALPLLLGGTQRAASGGHPAPTYLEQTERNLAYAIYALAAGAKLDPKFAAKRDELVTRAVAWNQRSPGGGFDHPLYYHDASECELGYGGSPFMSSLLVDALDFAAPTDPRVATVAGRVSDWLAASRIHDSNEAATAKTSYGYLVGCTSDTSYQVGWWQDLNTMITSAHGHAYRLTKLDRHRLVGEEMLAIGLNNFRADRGPKQFGQTAYAVEFFAAT